MSDSRLSDRLSGRYQRLGPGVSSAADLRLLHTCTGSTLSSRAAITARHSSKVHAGNGVMCRGHKSAAAAGAPTPLRSGPPTSSCTSSSTSCERPGGSAPRRLLQRCGAEAAPRCTEHAELLLLLLVPCCTGSHRAEPGCLHPSSGTGRGGGGGEEGQTNKQTNRSRLN